MVDQPTLRSLAVAAEALVPLLAVELPDWTSHALIPASAHREAATATAPRTEPAFMEAPQFVRETPGRTSGPGVGELGSGLSRGPRAGTTVVRPVGGASPDEDRSVETAR